MIIGFTTRMVCVPENNTHPGFDVWLLPIDLATVRTAERQHPMKFRLQVASSSAIVEPIGANSMMLLLVQETILVQCITLLRASAEVRVMKFARIAKLLLRVFRIT